MFSCRRPMVNSQTIFWDVLFWDWGAGERGCYLKILRRYSVTRESNYKGYVRERQDKKSPDVFERERTLSFCINRKYCQINCCLLFAVDIWIWDVIPVLYARNFVTLFNFVQIRAISKRRSAPLLFKQRNAQLNTVITIDLNNLRLFYEFLARINL